MQGIRAHFPRERNDRLAVEIAVRPLADLVSLVGEPGEESAAVDGGVNRERPHPEAPRRADDPAGNFATICDEDVCEHGRLPGSSV